MNNEMSWLVFILVAGLTSGVTTAAGVFVRELARKAARGELERNRVAGMRTKATLASDEAWLAGHIAAEADSVRGAQAMIAGSIVAFVIPAVLGMASVIGAEGALVTWTVLLMLGVGALVVYMLRATRAANMSARAMGKTS